MSIEVKFGSKKPHLGDFTIHRTSFAGTKKICEGFTRKEFLHFSDKQKSDLISEALLSLLVKAKEPSFLLAPVLDFLDQVNNLHIVEHYSLAHFELWLNQQSKLSAQENYRMRARIAGKWLPREEYQILFPIGMNKMYPGSHYVTAHGSPDLDTTIASFWGWMDAFAARVSEGLHLWNVPGGPPAMQVEIEILFADIFGKGVFPHLAKERTSLSLSSFELMTQQGFAEWKIGGVPKAIDYSVGQQALILVDPAGFYLGDWRDFDVESVRQVTMLVASCLRWFQTHFHLRQVALFAKPRITKKEAAEFFHSIFSLKFSDCEPAKEFSEKQKKQVYDYLTRVLHVANGLDATFEEFGSAIKKLGMDEFQTFVATIRNLVEDSSLFDRKGNLIEDRPHIFHALEKIIGELDRAIFSVRSYVEQLHVALAIKTEVFGYLPQAINFRAEIDEIKNKMGQHPYLTVTSSTSHGKMTPIGVIYASDLHKPILGTVSLRDFCNREETKIPAYLEIISVIDHHKSALQISSPSMVILSDAQSSNVIVAEMAFILNDRYSANGMSATEIQAQITLVQKDLSSGSQKRILQRLLQRQMVCDRKSTYFIDPAREFIEYLHFLYAILDDTDLLTKVSSRDLVCVVSLLNRLKSLMMGKEVEILHFDDLSQSGNFIAEASARILQSADLYSLCRNTYLAKENVVEENIALAKAGQPSYLFLDTKEQNGCCRVGQTKLFVRNFPSYQKYAAHIQIFWAEESQHAYKENPQIDLYVHMISTLSGAEDLFAGNKIECSHKDELWIWVPDTDAGIARLKTFLNAFRSSSGIIANQREHQLEVEFVGKDSKKLEEAFFESFIKIPGVAKRVKEKSSFVILRFKAGTINSRKTLITPYLPK